MKLTCRHLAIAAALIFSGLFAAAQKPKSPLELNNYFASITDSLYHYGVSWGSQFQKARESKDFRSLATHRKRIEDYANNIFQELVVMKDISGSEKLRAAVIDFLSYERRIIKEGFVPFEKFTKTSAEEDIQKAIDALVAAGKDESAILKAINDEQVAYGKKNGFAIEKPEE
jgi:hypothetical protein